MKQLENSVFADDFETEGILADEKLPARIRTGTKQAGERKGRFFYIVDDREKIVFPVSADTRQQSYKANHLA